MKIYKCKINVLIHLIQRFNTQQDFERERLKFGYGITPAL